MVASKHNIGKAGLGEKHSMWVTLTQASWRTLYSQPPKYGKYMAWGPAL